MDRARCRAIIIHAWNRPSSLRLSVSLPASAAGAAAAQAPPNPRSTASLSISPALSLSLSLIWVIHEIFIAALHHIRHSDINFRNAQGGSSASDNLHKSISV
ncbi:hypothetical protein QQF64_002995 [Cirrhinus molitorella]|uniref:Uncharacterized protein n=1 Tax=Cirrhinus molitorella TaxID=172907 RepID=A0ABR3MIW0_9TELE